jgi:hypothetical protein
MDPTLYTAAVAAMSAGLVALADEMRAIRAARRARAERAEHRAELEARLRTVVIQGIGDGPLTGQGSPHRRRHDDVDAPAEDDGPHGQADDALHD